MYELQFSQLSVFFPLLFVYFVMLKSGQNIRTSTIPKFSCMIKRLNFILVTIRNNKLHFIEHERAKRYLHRTWSSSGIGAFSQSILRWKPLRPLCEVLLRFHGRYDGEVGQSNQNEEVSGRKLVPRSDVSMYSTLRKRYPFVVLNLLIQPFREASNQFRDREISWNGDRHGLTVVVLHSIHNSIFGQNKQEQTTNTVGFTWVQLC